MCPEPPELQILLPIHNEAASIRATILEIEQHLCATRSHQFLLCEDGSLDDSKQVLRTVAQEVPARLLLSEERKGYSGAVRDGMLAAGGDYLLCLDSDGQCDPDDFLQFWDLRDTADILIGWRVHRADTWVRRSMSGAFLVLWRSLFPCPVHDPSCPFVLARRDVIRALAPQMGAMKQGFWWEFIARASRIGYVIKEVPVKHRKRAAGVTQVYRWSKLPGIGYSHFCALFRILSETAPPRANSGATYPSDRAA